MTLAARSLGLVWRVAITRRRNLLLFIPADRAPRPLSRNLGGFGCVFVSTRGCQRYRCNISPCDEIAGIAYSRARVRRRNE
jgi:hypothetical protein